MICSSDITWNMAGELYNSYFSKGEECMTYKRDTLDLLKFEMNSLSNSYLAEIDNIILDVSKQSLGNEE